MQTQPVDDIEAVLGRFSAWAGARNAVEAGTRVRELSDEEALRSGRYRWKGVGEGATRKKPTAEPIAAAAEPATDRVTADAKRDTTKKGAKRAAVSKPETRARKAVSAAAALAKKGAKAAPEFRDALAAEVVVAVPMEISRQVAISVRLAPAERALIRTRAAETGLSASAYIRQCALEVEQLRAQVNEAIAAIAAMERGGSEPVRASGDAPGFFARLAHRFFPRTEPVLALRA